MYSKKNMHLLKEFSGATGRDFYHEYSGNFDRDYKDWINMNKKLGSLYAEFIEYLGLPINSCNTAEVGKSEYDSVVLPFETKLVTTRFKEDTEYKDRIINGEFFIDGVYPYISTEKEGIKIIYEDINTYMIQNILSSNEITCWDYMHNAGIHNIIVGVYGRKNDLDVEKKLNLLRNLKDHLSADCLIDYTTVGDAYLGVVASKRKKLVLKDIPTFGSNIE